MGFKLIQLDLEMPNPTASLTFPFMVLSITGL